MICKKCKKAVPNDAKFCCYCGKSVIPEPRKKRNVKGFGSVCYLGDNRKKPYAVRISAGTVDGKRKRIYAGYYATKAEAMKALSMEQINPTSVQHKITFSELFLAWKDTRAYTDISHSTKDCYNAAYNHFRDIYDKTFVNLRTNDYQSCIDNAKNKSGAPLSQSGKRQMKILAGLLYKYALENDICHRSYAEFIRLDKTQKKEKETFSAEDIKKLEENTFLPGAELILILIYTGMRINEMLNLKITDIDFEKGVITGGLKTDAGRNRIIPIHTKIKDMLKKQCNHKGEYAFVRDDEIRLTDKYFRDKIYRPLLESLNIPYKTIHSTRHTCATLLTQAGADTEAISSILGHANYAFTADTYTHVNIDFLKDNLEKI